MSITVEKLNNESWFKITDYDDLRPFFISIVSDSNHWMFISSNGGLTAGRKNAQYALFPYYTDDKITELAHTTGSKSMFHVHKNGETEFWEPFCEKHAVKHAISRNLYKNKFGNKILFEEVNHDLELTFRYQWNSSNRFGFVKKSTLMNHGLSSTKVTLLDGIQNIMPHGVSSDLQTRSSNLVDAYKRSELDEKSGLGIFALSAIIVDKAEPSEALKANVAWSIGLENPTYTLSSLQLESFRTTGSVTQENDVKGEKGAYFVSAEVDLAAESTKKWSLVANVNQDHVGVVGLINTIHENEQLSDEIDADIERGTDELQKLIASSDGLQKTSDHFKDTRHYSNVLFNVMRGGIFDDNYQIEKNDFSTYLKNASKPVFENNRAFIDSLNDVFDKNELDGLLTSSDDADLIRLGKEYLPLKFSRRHGDPSRPWNQFSINTHSEEDGSKILDYEGNWRDIFQNWEALSHSFPGFLEGMIFKFLNATTFDGYNPYRVTKGGFDWETIEPDDPWSYIGYWGDHQIIYLLKFLEFYQNHQPEAFEELFGSNVFVYANVPYKIKSYDEIAKNPKDTIDFDEEADHKIREKVAEVGADGSLLTSGKEAIHHVNFIEKMLATVLAKVSNFIPEAGIWLNTQRPEWNDANNALVGNGVSMVTLYYLRRFLKFFEPILAQTEVEEVSVSKEVHQFFATISSVLNENTALLNGSISDTDRKRVTEALGKAGSSFRDGIYDHGFSGEKAVLDLDQVAQFVSVALEFMEHSIRANKRDDELYHAYNIMSMETDEISISYLDEMLEGQVAVLSSGYLSSAESLKVLDALRKSALYRADQQSYILYPNKQLPGFLEKNTITSAQVERSELLQQLVAKGEGRIITKDVRGEYHFNGNFKNAGDLKKALAKLTGNDFESLAKKEEQLVLQIFEEVFNHKAFTGRSGTFFGYEGLGSIYWHMVSKLHLAVCEVVLEAAQNETDATTFKQLATHFDDIGEGIGIHKSAEVYGAFPTDPYSHTPQHKGAQQPGMTGQVKEDILVRFGELGITVDHGKLAFNPLILQKDEFVSEEKHFEVISVADDKETVSLPAQTLGFTYCQVPVTYQSSDKNSVDIYFTDGTSQHIEGTELDEETSAHIFQRNGKVKQLKVELDARKLR